MSASCVTVEAAVARRSRWLRACLDHPPSWAPWPATSNVCAAPAAQLTRREREVAACIARGLSNRQIAAELVITTSTTERHVANILNKLAMRSRTQVAAWAAAHGLA